MPGIVTLTMNPAIDVNVRIDHLLPDRKLRCRDVRREPGGGGINVARVLASFDEECRALYAGGGATGKLLSSLLEKEGVNGEQIPVQEWTRENVMVKEASADQQYRFIMPGPELSQEEWEKCIERVEASGPDYLIASGSLPPGAPGDFYGQLAERMARNGTRTIVDTKGEALQEAARHGVYLLKPNMAELKELAGRELEDEGDIADAARELIGEGSAEVVVLSLGKGGAHYFSRDSDEHVSAPTVPVRSTVGAGDSMVAGIALCLNRGDSLDEAVRFGIAAGAAAVMTAGTELCRPDDARRLRQQID